MAWNAWGGRSAVWHCYCVTYHIPGNLGCGYWEGEGIEGSRNMKVWPLFFFDQHIQLVSYISKNVK